jgi:hypothetical protein|tara:strand:+ start:158 stop:577 length:420 start_codon:yes stop_codon:yes gene_type:complete
VGLRGLPMTDIVVDEQIKEEYKKENTNSRATKLALELSQERNRLKRELAELQIEVEDLTPTTPTGTPDWYVKWFSMTAAVIGVFALSAGFTQFGQIAYVLSSCGWVYVGMAWGDRAIMIGSAISGTAVMMNIVQGITNL